MVHDRRMLYSGFAHGKKHSLSADWAGDQCVVRLRRDRLSSKHTVHEKISDSTVTGLRFSRDVPNLVIGSWCYDHVYLFDLNHSPTYTSAIRGSPRRLLSQVRGREAPSDQQLGLPLIKRVRSNEPPAVESVLGVDVENCALEWSESNSERHNGSSSSDDDVVDDQTADPANLILLRSSRGVHGFSRGQSFGVRVLSNEEASYLLESDDEHEEGTASSGNSDGSKLHGDSSCNICCRPRHELEAAVDQPDGPSLLSHTERDMVHVSFDAFVTDVAEQLLVPALGSISFGIRQLDGTKVRPKPESLAALKSLNDIERIDEFRGSLLAMRLDVGLEHDRARSLLYNNRACISATIFRQKWIRRFDAYLRAADLHSYDLGTIQKISADFKAIKSELESAARDCNIALQLNHYNILAHYNRLLISWDRMRLDIMLCILELVPLVGNSAALQPVPRHDDNEPLLNRLRAELGDLSYRMREIQSRFHSECDTARMETQAIRCFVHVVDRAGKGDEGRTVLGCLVHTNERFFEVSSSLAMVLCEDADLVLRLFNQSRGTFDDSLLNSEEDVTDCYASAMYNLSMCWMTIGSIGGATRILANDTEAQESVFGA
ncbi:hypothetical protein H4S07_004902, partial [Coemansia furcata]